MEYACLLCSVSGHINVKKMIDPTLYEIAVRPKDFSLKRCDCIASVITPYLQQTQERVDYCRQDAQISDPSLYERF